MGNYLSYVRIDCFSFVKKKVKFTIKKNRHRSSYFPEIIFSNKIEGTITLCGDFYDSTNNRDTSKIYGISDDWHHQYNSCRLGFRNWLESEKIIELRVIVYNDCVRNIQTIKLLANPIPKKPIKYSIEAKGNWYYVMLDNQMFQFPRTSKWRGPRYILFPYYGGEDVAGKDYILEITR